MTDKPELPTAAEHEARKALHCLNLEAPASVVDDVKSKVLAWVAAVRADERARLAYVEGETVEIGRHRLQTIISATRSICSSGRFVLSMLSAVATEDPITLARIEELRDQIKLASDAIEEGGPWPADEARLEGARRALEWVEERGGGWSVRHMLDNPAHLSEIIADPPNEGDTDAPAE